MKRLARLAALAAILYLVYMAVEYPRVSRQRLRDEIKNRFRLPPETVLLAADKHRGLVGSRYSAEFRLPPTKTASEWLALIAERCDASACRISAYEYWCRGDYGIHLTFDRVRETYSVLDLDL